MWGWSEASGLVGFAVARGIGRLLVAVPLDLGDPARYRELVARCRGAGIAAEALGGAPGWIDAPGTAIERWLRPVLATGLFDGVHLDVEPHAHPGWDDDRPSVVAGYVELLRRVRAAVGTARLDADLADWFHTVPAGASTLDREAMRHVDAVTILAYRNRAEGDDGTIAIATPSVAAASVLGRAVRIGQETNDLGSAPDQRKQTFFGHSRRAMETQLAAVERAFGAWTPSFRGVSIHDVTGYGALAP